MSRDQNVFFTSDWHLFHEQSIEFDNRPFRNINHMHQVLVNNYNSAVGPNDICYFLGDMGMFNQDTISEAKKIIQSLNGFKIFIRGNHDKGPNAMKKMGFDLVLYGAILTIANEQVTLTHCPLKGLFREDCTEMRKYDPEENWHGEKRHLKFSIPNFGQYHLHGHIHSPNGGKSEKILDKQFDVGVPGNNYRPVSISRIESWISKRKKYGLK